MGEIISESISKLNGSEIGSFKLFLKNKAEGRFPEETNFEFCLKTSDEEVSKNSIILGKYFSGRGNVYSPWIEFDFSETIKFENKKIKITENNLDKNLFETVIGFLPPGGRAMVVYANHEETETGLEKSIPPSATRIGYLLYQAGCVWFKNWYFPEGRKEGRVKLQGEKPVTKKQRKEALFEIYRELKKFLKREKNQSEEVFRQALKRAEKITEEIITEYPDIE